MSNLKALFAQAPGSFGRLAHYLDSRLAAPSPHIAIPSALSILAAAKSNRIRLKRDMVTHPALFNCVVASSGSGKTESQKAIAEILNKCGMTGVIHGEPGTDSGILKSLQERPRQLIIWDEMGKALGHLVNSKNSREAKVLDVLTKIYSSTGHEYRGPTFVGREPVIIDNPHLSVIGASTPGRFFDSITEDFVEDGFIPRWLVFFEPEEKEKARDRMVINEVPTDIINYVKNLNIWIKPQDGGDIQKVVQVRMVDLRFDDDALKAHERVRIEFKLRREKASGEISEIVWSRAFENYCKVLICVAESEIADIDHVLWAAEIVEHCVKKLISTAAQRIRVVGKDAAREKFKNIIAIGECITRSELTDKTFGLNLDVRQRKDMIELLLEAGMWQSEERKIGNSRKKSQVYIRIK